MALNYFLNPNLSLKCGHNMCIIDETVRQSTYRGSMLPESPIYISLHACSKFQGGLCVKIPQTFGNQICGVHNYQENNSFNLACVCHFLPLSHSKNKLLCKFCVLKVQYTLIQSPLTHITLFLKGRNSPHKLQELKNKKKPTKCHLLFNCTSYGLNMFRALLCPSSGARNYDVDYHIGRFILGLLYIGGQVRLAWSSVRAAG